MGHTNTEVANRLREVAKDLRFRYEQAMQRKAEGRWFWTGFLNGPQEADALEARAKLFDEWDGGHITPLINSHNEEVIKCPMCAEDELDSWEIGENTDEFQCGTCELTFDVRVHWGDEDNHPVITGYTSYATLEKGS